MFLGMKVRQSDTCHHGGKSSSRTHVFEDQSSPWRESSCLARYGGLEQVDDDVAETHWQRKVVSP